MSFLEDFEKLRNITPRPGSINFGSVNSEYCESRKIRQTLFNLYNINVHIKPMPYAR